MEWAISWAEVWNAFYGSDKSYKITFEHDKNSEGTKCLKFVVVLTTLLIFTALVTAVLFSLSAANTSK